MTESSRRSFPWLILFAVLCAGLGLANRACGWGVGGWLTAALIVLPVVAGLLWGMFKRTE
ncbi:hypothetical protein [Deinococcus aerius]|uniref:hypothetical protein n=1 Tax=Deinococcus aerius TaxID=200253 RepID=UPI0010575051|nr:hypothetical protein [Deinococcus aerius]